MQLLKLGNEREQGYNIISQSMTSDAAGFYELTADITALLYYNSTLNHDGTAETI